ncbi:MAG: HD domain-containing protein [Bacteroidales bacterium]|jgi:putative nucleotidyltransferase with HDIG domain|nr:HD domain-containing protein [Bacteroidales bacterium]
MHKSEDYYQKFKDYTDKFLHNAKDELTKKNIQLKITHSINVENNSKAIALSGNLDSGNVFIAGLCGLFHDIGRFEQYTRYNTFRDDESIYHGQLGVEVLNDTKMLNKLPEKTNQIILQSTYNHGLLSIPETEDPDVLLFSKITRDADKIDIYRIVAEYYHNPGPRNIALEYGLEHIPAISENVMDNFYKHKVVSKENLSTLNDFKAMQLSWIFDINFSHTKKTIIQNKYPDIILSSMEDTPQKKELQEIIKSYFLSA